MIINKLKPKQWDKAIKAAIQWNSNGDLACSNVWLQPNGFK